MERTGQRGVPPRRRRRRRYYDTEVHPWIPVVAVAVAVLVVAAIVFPFLRLSSPYRGPQLLILGPIRNATLGLGPVVGVHPADPFYSAVFDTGSMDIASLDDLGAFFNSTPINLFRWGGTEQFDPTTATEYEPPSSGYGQYVAVPNAQATLNLTWMKSWCDAKTPHCSWIGSLPAELNNTQAAVHAAQWYHSVLGFAPTYWQLGNEPESWTHYGENWTQWSTYDDSTPTGPAYATMVQDYIAAVHAVYPADQFVGLEASGPGNIDDMPEDTAALDGASVAAMAYHTYPPPTGGGSSLDQLYQSLLGPQNVSATANEFRAAVTSECGSCANLPIQIGEFQAGPADAINPLALTYAGAPYLASAIIEALRANVSTFTVFDNSWLVNKNTGAVLPEGLLYQRLLDNMTMGTDFATSLTAPGVTGLFSIEIQNGPHVSLLVVNTDPSASIRLAVPTDLFQNGSLGSYWLWGPTVPDPIAYPEVPLPSVYEVPEEGILLIDNY